MMASILCIAGKSRIAIDAYNVAKAQGFENIKVICNATDDGQDRWQPSFRKFAIDNGIEIVSLDQCYELESVVFLSAEFDRIVKPARFEHSARLYNIHFSALPKYKGMYTSSHPILNGEKETGCTLHVIDPGIDTGPIIDSVNFAITETDFCKSLYDKYQKNAVILLKKNIAAILSGNILSAPQSPDGSTYYSKKSIDYRNLAIDLGKTCWEIGNAIRAFNHRAYQIPSILGRNISFSRPTGQLSRARPGTVLFADDRRIEISTIDYDCDLIVDRFDELLSAAGRDDVATLAMILSDNPLLINECDERGWTPLIVACFNGATACVDLLLSHGADVDRGNVRGTTPLMYAKDHALRSGDVGILETLVRHGADTGARDIAGFDLRQYLERDRDNAMYAGIVGCLTRER